jgi:hypothetical protein
MDLSRRPRRQGSCRCRRGTDRRIRNGRGRVVL